MTQTKKPRATPDNPHPFADTAACMELAKAMAIKSREEGLSLRQIAAKLGMSSAQLSHMANGRMGIPLDGAGQLAENLGIDAGKFIAAVFKQRHPGAASRLDLDAATAGGEDATVRLEYVLGGPLEALEAEHRSVIQEVAQSRSPRSRWATPAEAAFLKLLREARPHGPSEGDFRKLEKAVREM